MKTKKNWSSEKFGDTGKKIEIHENSEKLDIRGIPGYRENLNIHENLEKREIREIQGYLESAEIHENLEKQSIREIPEIHENPKGRSTFPKEIGAHLKRKSDNNHSN